MTSNLVTCGRCFGAKTIERFRNYANGVCFQCGGTGKESAGYGKPSKGSLPSPKSSVVKEKEVELPTLGRVTIELHTNGDFALVQSTDIGPCISWFRLVDGREGRKVVSDGICEHHADIFGGTAGFEEELTGALRR
jgi:hypothetical protein